MTEFCAPIFPAELKETEISEVLPGAIGSFGQLVAVQPQVTATFEMIKGEFPELVNVKV